MPNDYDFSFLKSDAFFSMNLVAIDFFLIEELLPESRQASEIPAARTSKPVKFFILVGGISSARAHLFIDKPMVITEPTVPGARPSPGLTAHNGISATSSTPSTN